MMKRAFYIFGVILLINICSCTNSSKTVSITDYGVKPDTREDIALAFKKLISDLQQRTDTGRVIVVFPKGTYHFYEDNSIEREYYISNHDQSNPKRVGLALENLKNVTIEGKGSTFIFHGRMIPMSILNS